MDTNEQKLTVERFITLVSDPLEATRHFNGRLKDAFQSMYNEISANETALTTFTHAMGYMQEIAEMYYTSLSEEKEIKSKTVKLAMISEFHIYKVKDEYKIDNINILEDEDIPDIRFTDSEHDIYNRYNVLDNIMFVDIYNNSYDFNKCDILCLAASFHNWKQDELSKKLNKVEKKIKQGEKAKKDFSYDLNILRSLKKFLELAIERNAVIAFVPLDKED